MEISLQTLLGIIFGVGGTGALTVGVAAYRRLKTGKISDDDTVIKRVHRELTRQEARADTAERERDIESRHKQHWREQAWQYRLQLIEAGITPKELPLPSEE